MAEECLSQEDRGKVESLQGRCVAIITQKVEREALLHYKTDGTTSTHWASAVLTLPVELQRLVVSELNPLALYEVEDIAEKQGQVMPELLSLALHVRRT
jgi:hypothetical protein